MSDVSKIKIEDLEDVDLSSAVGGVESETVAVSMLSNDVNSEVEVMDFETDNDSSGNIFSDIGAVIGDAYHSLCESMDSIYDWMVDTAYPAVADAGNKVKEVLESTLATIGAAVTSFVEGVLSFGESIFDVLGILGSAVLTPFTALYDLVTDGSATKFLWDSTMAFVSEQFVSSWFDSFYDNTSIGNIIKDKSFLFEQTRAVSSGIGYVTGVILFSLLTFGAGGAVIAGDGVSVGTLAASTSATQMSVVSGLAGIGRGAQDAWAEGASLSEGLVSGTFTGLWEGLQFYLGGKIGGSNIFKAGDVISEGSAKIINSLSKVILDGVDGGAEGLVQPFLKAIYSDGYYDDAGNYIEFNDNDNFIKRFSENFDDMGGLSNILTNAAVGSFSSIIGEAFDLKKYFKNSSTADSNLNISDSVNTVDLSNNNMRRLDYEINEMIDPNLDPVSKARKLYIELNKRVSYDSNYIVGDENIKKILFDQKIDFEHLADNKVICSGWSELYRQLLIENGFDSDAVKIMGKNHNWVEINLGNHLIIIADATEKINGSIDLANCKAGFSTNGFAYLYDDFSGTQLSKNVDVLNYAADMREFDEYIGYISGGYQEDLLQEARDKFSISQIFNKLFGKSDCIQNFIDMSIPDGLDGLDYYYYCKNIKDILFDNDSSMYLGYFFTKIGDQSEMVTNITLMDADRNLSYILYSESLGKHVFYNAVDLENFKAMYNLNMSMGSGS